MEESITCFLGISQQHGGVLFVEDRVVHSSIAHTKCTLHHNGVLTIPDLQVEQNAQLNPMQFALFKSLLGVEESKRTNSTECVMSVYVIVHKVNTMQGGWTRYPVFT